MSVEAEAQARRHFSGQGWLCVCACGRVWVLCMGGWVLVVVMETSTLPVER